MKLALYQNNTNKKFRTPPGGVLNGLVANIDFSDLGSIVQSAGVIDRINDSSGGQYYLTATTTKRPSLVLSAKNGLSVGRFDGTDDILKATTYIPNSSGTYSYYVVYKFISWVSGAKSIFANGDVNTGISHRLNANRNVVHNAVAAQTDGAITPGTWEIVHVTRTTTPLTTLYLNNVSQTLTPNNSILNNPTSGFFTIGGRQGAGVDIEQINADIGQVVLYNVAHSTEEQTAIYNALKTKWGF